MELAVLLYAARKPLCCPIFPTTADRSAVRQGIAEDLQVLKTTPGMRGEFM